MVNLHFFNELTKMQYVTFLQYNRLIIYNLKSILL